MVAWSFLHMVLAVVVAAWPAAGRLRSSLHRKIQQGQEKTSVGGADCILGCLEGIVVLSSPSIPVMDAL